MGNMKTEEQINAEISALEAMRSKVRQYNHFGGNNHAAIDAEIAVLRGRMSASELYEKSDEFDCCAFQTALRAIDWMTGAAASDEDSPSEGWDYAQE